MAKTEIFGVSVLFLVFAIVAFFGVLRCRQKYDGICTAFFLLTWDADGRYACQGLNIGSHGISQAIAFAQMVCSIYFVANPPVWKLLSHYTVDKTSAYAVVYFCGRKKEVVDFSNGGLPSTRMNFGIPLEHFCLWYHPVHIHGSHCRPQ